MKVCHILPTTPPDRNGVADYGFRLWQSWPEPRPEWHVAAMRIPDDVGRIWPEAILHRFDPTPESLAAALASSGATTVFLHYVPHAYHPKGIPTWLPSAFDAWKAKTGGKLAIFFHETLAEGPLFSKTRLLLPLAKAVFAKVASRADAWATSTESYVEDVRRFRRGPEVPFGCIAVGTNVLPIRPPAPRPATREAGAKLRVAAFGSAGSRLGELEEHRALLSRLAKEDRLESLLIVGAPAGPEQAQATKAILDALGQISVREAFDLEPEEVSSLLLEQDVALIATPVHLLGKSGVYAACASHGLACLLPGDREVGPEFWGRRQYVPTWDEIAATLKGLVDRMEAP